jgi:hypothetical protein
MGQWARHRNPMQYTQHQHIPYHSPILSTSPEEHRGSRRRMVGYGENQSWLIEQPFVWPSDGGGLTMFFESDKFHTNPIHMFNQWRAELLQYHFHIKHRPALMMTKSDLLLRYNAITADWRVPTTKNTDDTT